MTVAVLRAGTGPWIPAYAGMTVAVLRAGTGPWIPACAGMTVAVLRAGTGPWIPAYAGMTRRGVASGDGALDSRLRGNDGMSEKHFMQAVPGFPPARECGWGYPQSLAEYVRSPIIIGWLAETGHEPANGRRQGNRLNNA